jgi:hypothetical protein
MPRAKQLTVWVPDRPGMLGEAGINIRYSYPGSAGSARRVNVYFGVSDLKAALKAARER